jgi:hypothetical protein
MAVAGMGAPNRHVASIGSTMAGMRPMAPPALSTTSQWPTSFAAAGMRGGPDAIRGAFASTGNTNVTNSSSTMHMWDSTDRYSPTDSVDDILASPNLSDALDGGAGGPSTSPRNNRSIGGGGAGAGMMGAMGGAGVGPKGRGQRRPSNRDEFDGPHQFLARPSAETLVSQEKELPHLPTNLHVQEQDDILRNVNDRLSQCAYDFVAKYQFPIPLTQDMRPVERPQDREWTEWVYLLKRLATKRRIPARVLYNSQIKQLVTVLENSLEMRHAAKHQSRPLKDDRNVLQLISAGIQVAKILKDAYAMEFLDRIYVETETKIQERVSQRGWVGGIEEGLNNVSL